eukprot:PhM_4_TR8301/c1_g1_i4/m.24976
MPVKPRKKSDAQNQKEARLLEAIAGKLQGTFRSTTTIRHELARLDNIAISSTHLRRKLDMLNVLWKAKGREPYQWPGDREKRVTFAKAMLAEQKRTGGTFFRRLVFSDEAYIAVGDASTHAWMWSHEFIPRLCTAHPASIMLWAGISELGATEIKFCEFEDEKRMGAVYYQDNVLQGPWKAFRQSVPTAILVDDGASAHRAKSVIESYAAQESLRNYLSDPVDSARKGRGAPPAALPITKALGWPPRSPDLNPVENMWGMLKDKKNKQGCRTVEEIKTLIKIFSQSQEHIDFAKRTAARFEKLLEECVERKGDIVNKRR